jgi:hypothetical protein
MNRFEKEVTKSFHWDHVLRTLQERGFNKTVSSKTVLRHGFKKDDTPASLMDVPGLALGLFTFT